MNAVIAQGSQAGGHNKSGTRTLKLLHGEIVREMMEEAQALIRTA